MTTTLDLDQPRADHKEPYRRLERDIFEGVGDLAPESVRYLVDTYYAIQDYRIQAKSQVRAAFGDEEPHGFLLWQLELMEYQEAQIKRALDKYTDQEPSGMGAWAKGIYGIGPVISAGLIAHLDITQAPTTGHIWRFAGLDPTQEWLSAEKSKAVVKTVAPNGAITFDQIAELSRILGRNPERLASQALWAGKNKPPRAEPTPDSVAKALSRRPFNAKLKTLCWKIGQSFMKFHNQEACFYGHLYAERKAQYIAKNEAGGFAEAAAEKLATVRIGHDTDAYKAYSQGKLPPAHVDAMARRYAVKLFLAHWHDEAYRRHYKTEPPLPYPIAHLGHAHMIQPPVSLAS